MNVTYVAGNLEAIAELFETRAVDASNAANHANTIRNKARLFGEAYAWAAAANMLRKTKLENRNEAEKMHCWKHGEVTEPCPTCDCIWGAK